ncbi:GGDEF domain protein [Sulfuricella denitrificans skB26]|uniref:GGDEF domain protein n=1 Tax=Sulfuricella denitrificans (strain DSM 22764 / NBRC 105220 / skB26) TaxID=1163617 RepID=S6AEP8_SULDS|nr:EAL domain-containing protein [Sulfuricella denitrificans]BAN34266.1 GGDEF domain protein [Sulfuricella denitrificans skB26]
MKLSRLLVIIISALWLLIFIGTLSITIRNSRDYLVNQMLSHAQDTATSLGLSLTTSVEHNDLATTNSMVDAIFDRGYYRYIVIRKISGDTLVERSQALWISDVPEWFTHAFTLETPQGKALIMHGWKQVGTVEVVSHPGHAYKELWRVSMQAFWWTLVVGIVSLLAVVLVMRFALAPLSVMEAQALGISRRRFTIMKKIPWARELRRVAQAMNTMCSAVERMLNEQTALTEKMHSKAYLDSVTGLANGRNFNERLFHLLNSPDEFAAGGLIFVRLDKFKEYNETYGHAAGNALLCQAGEILVQLCGQHERTLLARMNGAEFAILVPDIAQDGMSTLADVMIHKLSELQRTSDTGETTAVVYAGTAFHQAGQSTTALLSTADNALHSALKQGTSCWQLYSGEQSGKAMELDSTQWKDLITTSLQSGKIILHFQPVVSCQNRSIMHHEALARMATQDGSLLAASAFMPIAKGLGLAREIDRYVVEKVLTHLDAVDQPHAVVAINLSAASLRDEGFIEWLCTKLADDKVAAKRLIFETAEHGVVADIQTARHAIQQIHDAGAKFSIDRFGHSAASFGYLRNLHADYIKIDGSYIRHIARNEDSQFFVQSLAGIAHGLEIIVIAEYVETAEDYEALKALSVDGAQGYYIGKPE